MAGISTDLKLDIGIGGSDNYTKSLPSLFSSLSCLRSHPPSYARSQGWRLSASATPSLWRNLDRVQVLGDDPSNGYGHKGIFDLSRSGRATQMSVAGKSWEERPESQCCIKVLECHSKRVKRIITEDSPDRFLSVSEDRTVRQHDLRTSHDCHTGRCPPPLVKLPYSLSALACSPITPFYFVVAGDSAYGHLFDRRMMHRILKYEWGQDALSDSSEDATKCVRRFGRVNRGRKEGRKDTHVTGAKMSESNGQELLLSMCSEQSVFAVAEIDYLFEAYSADAAYLYNVRDPVQESHKPTSILPNNSGSKRPSSLPKHPIPARRTKAKKSPPGLSSTEDEWAGISTEDTEEWHGIKSDGESADLQPGLHSDASGAESFHGIDDEESPVRDDDEGEGSRDESGDEEAVDYIRDEEEGQGIPEWNPLGAPVVLPRQRYSGMCNVETVKDVNFLGPYDEYVVSGSDDGNFFIWNKKTAELMGIWEGDAGIVNVVEDRPASHSYPMLAVSGLDHTVKVRFYTIWAAIVLNRASLTALRSDTEAQPEILSDAKGKEHH
ncbi:hypothetical protein FRB99_005540 [Tulasnella sp. 403]|nr:hypothetical protein FRB99_005540 [Tulasnella sp. 403]